ncbi:ArsA-related P-loop ATPase [Nocardiopsis salina]|uniref:ArsA-related P-loop ATPase n=1 Tax=Nocardiopsis salina TaxID=245836 RepID=UPI000346B7FF|nr:ArsA-related P-loop ATPase [Nocardiopsis salina]
MSECEHRSPSSWDPCADARLHIVTGKGGTGKTTAAAALATALASGGGRTLLVEVEGRQGVTALLERSPLPHEERPMLSAPGGGTVSVLAADPESALMEYLELFYGMRRAGQALTRLGAVDFATTVAPGVRDVLLTGKATEAVRRREGHRGRMSSTPPGSPFAYDAVVMDAPPTGRIGRFLDVNSEVAGLARVGPVHDHAERAAEVIRSERTRVHVVTLLEEMPAQETADGLDEIAGLGLHPGAVLINMVRPQLLGSADVEAAHAGTLDRASLVAGLAAAGLPEPGDLAAGLQGELHTHAVRTELEERIRGELASLGRPVLELPRLARCSGEQAVQRLAGALTEQGVRR